MGVNLFRPSPNREAAMQALREGMSPGVCAIKYSISVRTAWRYLNQIKPKAGKAEPRQPKETRDAPVKITLEMGSEEFTKLLDMLMHHFENDNLRHLTRGVIDKVLRECK